ncbi:hypothetical protein C2869_03125 [Saccharobesus litoralis]|uniref:Uncharacterized protein n=1 Tax=Saccharobesus litoralis TaxID=2172099 RepID=A0A2S0VMR2_9ALTE|nr:hypothetical protein [Saccharobesus litoralis]AWB65486.1 hypothetical protein C2869_03125 [Saccharobesus litoralis]
MQRNYWFILAGCLSIAASLLHIACIIGGSDWYRFLGAGEQMAQMAERGEITPTLITLFISGVLATWGLYAFSAAKFIPRLPLLKFCMLAITAVYCIRGFGGLIVALFPNSYQVQHLGIEFVVWSSLICAIFGVVHIVAVKLAWLDLSSKPTVIDAAK